MSLIVEYHVIADMYPVGATAIQAGMLVSIGTGGLVVPLPTGTGKSQIALGIAGDSKLTSAGITTAYSDQVHLGSDGSATRWTSNRVSDFYDETAASQKITVYNGGGKFWISAALFDTAGVGIGASDLLKVGGTSGYWTSGGLDDSIVGVAVGAITEYPSGVPGTDTDGHITLGHYIPVILRI
jgi:hypothetical protein